MSPTRNLPRNVLDLEAMRAWDLYQQGIIRELYFRQDREDAVLVLECADPKEASEVLGSLSLVREGLISFELIPLVPYPGFDRLFNKQLTMSNGQ